MTRIVHAKMNTVKLTESVPSNIFIICTVRNATDDYRKTLEDYVKALEDYGHNVHLPHRDTNQGLSGYNICIQNAQAISNSDSVHIFYNPDSQGTHFDMGVAFALHKRIVLVERPPLTEGKSFTNMLIEWESYTHNIDYYDD